jgi:hypothetical protein
LCCPKKNFWTKLKNKTHPFKLNGRSLTLILTLKVLQGLFPLQTCKCIGNKLKIYEISSAEFLKFVGPIGPRGQQIMRSANNVGNAGPHVRQTFLNDVFTFLTEVRKAGSVVNTGTSSVNSEFVTALNTRYFICFW